VGNCGFGQVSIDGVCKNYKWSFGPNLPVDLGENGGAIIGNSFITFGDGQLGLGTNKWTYEFNFATNSWANPQNGAARAQRPFWGDHAASELFNGKIYVFAGLCCQTYCHGTCGATSKVQIYDIAADVWTIGADIPWLVDGSMASALINNKIYVCGGVIFDEDKSLKKCGIYDVVTNSWNLDIPDMPYDVHHTASNTGE
jgi:N-acetylneuraminic acid mutarotase